VVVVFNLLASLTRGHLLLHLQTSLDSRMTLGFLEHMVELPYAFFQQRSAGDLMMRLNSNTVIRQVLTSGAVSALLDGTLVFVYLGLLLWASPRMGALVLGLGVLHACVFVFSRRQVRDLSARGLQTQARSQGYLVQLLAGMESLKVCGAEDRAVQRWSSLYVDELNLSLEKGRLQALVDSVNGALRLGSPLLILGYGAWLVLAGQLSLGSMLALNALGVGFLVPLSTLVTTALDLQRLRSYVERIDDVLGATPEHRPERLPAPPLSGRVAMERVSFRYSPVSPAVLREVSLEVNPGQMVAVVGRSGAGKTTLAALLAGLHDPTGGRVKYDERDLATLDLRSVRGQLGIVCQQPYLFSGSVRDNIALGRPEASEEEVTEAARLAHVHDDILAMPMGYQTEVAAGGASLSGGQRQRIALARALLLRPAALILDEATSALDAATERAVQKNLQRLRCTRIVIAHRLSTIRQADRILLLEGGRLVEDGTHEQLLARGGRYLDLVSAQFGEEVTS